MGLAGSNERRQRQFRRRAGQHARRTHGVHHVGLRRGQRRIVNPPGAAFIFNEVTAHLTAQQRHMLSDKVALYSLGVMLGGAIPVLDGEPEFRPDLGLSEPADADFLPSAVGLVWRALILWLLLILLLTLANWAP